jgi:hypothetical protein
VKRRKTKKWRTRTKRGTSEPSREVSEILDLGQSRERMMRSRRFQRNLNQRKKWGLQNQRWWFKRGVEDVLEGQNLRLTRYRWGEVEKVVEETFMPNSGHLESNRKSWWSNLRVNGRWKEEDRNGVGRKIQKVSQKRCPKWAIDWYLL